MRKMNPAVKQKWIDALRSGKYSQVHGCLREDMEDDEGCKKVGYCCLGVLCDVHRKVNRKEGWKQPVTAPDGLLYGFEARYLTYGVSLPPKVQGWSGLDDGVQSKLMELNDQKGWTFKQIAAYIERNL